MKIDKYKGHTTRDLSTVEAHIERAKAWSRDLFATHDIDVYMSNGDFKEGQIGLLDNIRQDTKVLLSIVDEHPLLLARVQELEEALNALDNIDLTYNARQIVNKTLNKAKGGE